MAQALHISVDMETLTDKLIKFISDHGHDATVLADGRIIVRNVYCVGTDDFEVLAPTMRAVRDWLGY